MAFELFTGRVPFHDTDAPIAILLRHVNDPIPPVSSIDPSIDGAISDWIDRLLVKDPLGRTSSAAAAWCTYEEIIERLLPRRWRRDAALTDATSDTAPSPETVYVTYRGAKARAAPPPAAAAEAAAGAGGGPDPAELAETIPAGAGDAAGPGAASPSSDSRTRAGTAPRRPGRRRRFAFAALAALVIAGAAVALPGGGRPAGEAIRGGRSPGDRDRQQPCRRIRGGGRP